MARNFLKSGHLARTLEFIRIRNDFLELPRLVLNGKSLRIPELSALASLRCGTHVHVCEEARQRMCDNSQYLADKVAAGCDIYGVNTGYGGSADVRSNNILELQKALIRHLNAGFGDTLPSPLVRAVMAVRINSLSNGYSGVRPSTVQLLADMLNEGITPVVPKRGSVSASGDLMPTSYIAACMMGRHDAMVVKTDVTSADDVTIQNDITIPAPQALKEANLEPVIFEAKEALAVVNSTSFGSSLASLVLYDANIAVLLTQMATALSVEALGGRAESFHPTIHQCLPHEGQQEAARNILGFLQDSKFAIAIGDNANDRPGVLRQDRYALRSSPQWLAPVLETMQRSVDRVTIEINSANDNPIIDHTYDEILHGANFQGTSITVAMDQCRQGLQLCGKLLMGQFQEIINGDMNNGLTPNLAGSDVNVDFGFKGMDTAMAAYQSELDYLTNNITNHMLSTELHNQAVNSMALVSARYTQQALEILQMMIANIMCAQLQAIDLRHLKHKAEILLDQIFDDFGVDVNEPIKKALPWYLYVFTPKSATSQLLQYIDCPEDIDTALFIDQIQIEMNNLIASFQNGDHIQEVEDSMGTGTRRIYSFLRKEKQVPFYYAQTTPDTLLTKIHTAILNHEMADVLSEMLDSEDEDGFGALDVIDAIVETVNSAL